MTKTKPIQTKEKIAKKKAKQAPKKNTPGPIGRTSARQRLVAGDVQDADDVEVKKKRRGTSCRDKTKNKLVKVAAEEKRGSKNKAVQLKSLGIKKQRKLEDWSSISSHSGVPHSQSEPQSHADALQEVEAFEGDEDDTKKNKKGSKLRAKRLSAGWGYGSTVLGSNQLLSLVRYFSYFICATCILTPLYLMPRRVRSSLFSYPI